VCHPRPASLHHRPPCTTLPACDARTSEAGEA
jgi:hypothetical protein